MVGVNCEVGILTELLKQVPACTDSLAEVGGKKEDSSKRTNEFRQKLLKLINCIKSLGQPIFLFFPIRRSRFLIIHLDREICQLSVHCSVFTVH